MKRYISLIICLMVTNFINSQTLREKLLRTDSIYISLQHVVKNIYIKYSANDVNYSKKFPDSVKVILEHTFNQIEERRLQFDRMSLPNVDLDDNEETARKKHLTDSLINLNKIEFKGQVGLSLGFSSNQEFIGTQYAFLINSYRKVDFGLGVGVEYVNRGMGLVSLIQSSVFLTNKYFISRRSFLNFDYGYTIPLSATYTDKNDKKINFIDSELQSNYFLVIGIGTFYTEESSIQLNIRNQSLGVPDPLNQRRWMFGVKLNF